MELPIVRVAAAIIAHGNRILACRRGRGPMAGGWEFPGGKIEATEDGASACKREVFEELGCRLSTTWPLQTVEYDYPDFHLHMECFVSMLVPGDAPTLSEHTDMRWLSQEELFDVEWLPADIQLVQTIGSFWDSIFMSEHV